MAYNNPTSNDDKQAQAQEQWQSQKLTFYPAFCFKASPTHFTWVKMGAADVHRLKKRAEFGDQGLFFYLNHPIRFVNLVGMIVSRNDVPRRTILTLDDSSGATVDVVVLKADPATPGATTGTGTGNVPHPHPPPPPPSTTTKATHLTTTTRTPLDITPLVPGALVQIKGTLSIFRSTMQVQLERFFSVRETNAEMRFLAARCRFLAEVLSGPWVLGEEDIEVLRREADEEAERVEGEQERRRRRRRRRGQREEKERRRIERDWEREEAVREEEARVCREAGVELMTEIAERKRRRIG